MEDYHNFDNWKCSDSHREVDVIYLVFKKSFDSLLHKNLSGFLQQYAIHAKTMNWIKDFNSERQKRVVINDSKSSWKSVHIGIP